MAVCVAMILPLWAYSEGPDPFKTGGPFPNESSCAEAGCHASPNRINTGQGKVTITVSPYKPGQTQRIVVNVSDPAPTQKRWGFQLTARPANALATSAGTFAAANNFVQVICGDPARPNLLALPCGPNRVQFAEHTLSGTRNGTTGGVDFQIDWTPPDTNVGDVILAAAGNAANGNATNDIGDNIYTTKVTVSAAVDSGPAPLISSGGVIGAGLSNPPVKTISPNGIISVFGANFAPAGTVKLVGGGDLVNGQLPSNFGGLCVQVGSQRARFFHVFEKQLNIQAPTLTDRGNISVQVIQNCDQPNAVQSNVETVVIQDAAPEFFFFKQNADGKNPIAAVNALTGAFIGAANLIPGVTFVAAKPNDILSLFATGLGATNPSFQAGVLPDKIASTTTSVGVTVGGITANVLYAGVAPGLAGLYQINIQVPANATDGDLPVQAAMNSVSTPAGAFITVKK